MPRLNRLAAQRLQTKKKSPANWPSSQRQLVSKAADQPASWPREEDRPCGSKLSMATAGFNQGQILTPRILKASIKQDMNYIHSVFKPFCGNRNLLYSRQLPRLNHCHLSRRISFLH